MLQDRLIIIEELHRLLNKVKLFIFQNIEGFKKEDEAKDFINSFIMQCLILWFLQSKGFFNKDTFYMITKFRELSNSPSFKNCTEYYDFFCSFLDTITCSTNTFFYEDHRLGELIICGLNILIVDMEKLKSVIIPNKCFYTEEKIDNSFEFSSTKNNDDLPIFNALKSRKWENRLDDDYLFGAIYEKLITYKDKKKKGAFYTPESITSHISNTTLHYYLIEKVNNVFETNFKILSEIIESSNEIVISYLFKLILNVKILDPAVGTGHFLEGAVKVLLNIYRNIWFEFKKKGLSKHLNLHFYLFGRKENSINFMDLSDEEKLNFYMSLYILTTNIYGSDISTNAIRIAKARLFLFFVKHFNSLLASRINPMEIVFNIKSGNSLIGFEKIPINTSLKQLDLQSFFPDLSTDMAAVTLNVPPEYYNSTLFNRENLKQREELLSDLKHLEMSFVKNKSIDSILDEVISLLSKLNVLEIRSTNSSLRESTHSLTIQIKSIIRSELDILYSNLCNIGLKELKSLKPFHWPLEFPEIFSEDGGFNIIITNPPYLGESGNKNLFRFFSKCLNQYYEGKIDLWYLFLHRSLDLMVSDAYLSLLTSNYWLTAFGAEKLRTRILTETSIINFINFGENKAFTNAQGIHTSILTLKKSKIPNSNISVTLFNKTYPLNTNLIEKIDEQNIFQNDQRKLVIPRWDSYFHFLPEEFRGIIEFITNHSVMLKEAGFYTKEGIVTGLNKITGKQIKKYDLPVELKGLGVFILDENDIRDKELMNSFDQLEFSLLKPFYKNSDIKRYHSSFQTKKRIIYLNRKTVNIEELPNIKKHLKNFSEILTDSLDNPPYINRPRNPIIFTGCKLITPQRSIRNTFAYNSIDWYAAQDVYYILSKNQSRIKLKILLLILNSRIAYFWLYWMGKRKGRQLELFGDPLNYFPIPHNFESYQKLSDLADYLLFFYSLDDTNKDLNRACDYFENILIESLVYELYINSYEKKQSIDGPPLYYLVLDYIKQVNFEHWYNLLNEKLDSNNSIENINIKIEKYQEEIFQKIFSTFESLSANDQIVNKIRTINNQEWYQIIKNFFLNEIDSF